MTVTHLHTRGLAEIVRTADIVISAAGHAGLVKPDWLRRGAIVIDVGINETQDNEGRRRIVGFADPACIEQASAMTSVPGGVGPTTIACLGSGPVNSF